MLHNRALSLYIILPLLLSSLASISAWFLSCKETFTLTCLMSEAPPNQNWWWWVVNFGMPLFIALGIIMSVHVQTNGFTTRTDGRPLVRLKKKKEEVVEKKEGGKKGRGKKSKKD